MTRTMYLYAVAPISFCITGGMISWWNLQASADAYADAVRSLARIESMSEEIAFLRGQSSTAQLMGEQSKQEIKPWVERASQVGASQPSNFMVSPLRKIAKSDYSQEDVAITLQDVSMRQVVGYLTRPNESTEYTPTIIDLKFSAKGTKSVTDERWVANLVLTRLIYTAINRPGAD